jgi:hypothetical protein
MANLQRLTKRVNEMEEWIKENEMTGGPQGVLETFVLMVNETRASTNLRVQAQQTVQNLRALAFEFIEQHELTEEWNEFLADKEKDAVQEQSPEEVPSLTEAEDGEEVGEEDTKGKKPSKEEKSKETKK